MGAKLVQYYEFARQRGGLALQVKLAMLTCLAQPRAAEAPDSPENVRRFFGAMRQLLGDDPAIPRP